MCKPCPQGTWNRFGGLKTVQDCIACSERYVCPLEGTTKFATIEQKCGPNPKPDEICYPQNSLGEDCPQGYGCGLATTAYTQYDNYCEPGFWCKPRTVPSETRNLLCPPGYYCKKATGESGGSGRKAFQCPIGFFCPEGTAAEDGRVDNTLVTLLSNIQSNVTIVTRMFLARMSMCRRCPEDVVAGKFNLSYCTPCGEIRVKTSQNSTGIGQDTTGAGTRRLTTLDTGASMISGQQFLIPYESDESMVDVSEDLPDFSAYFKENKSFAHSGSPQFITDRQGFISADAYPQKVKTVEPPIMSMEEPSAGSVPRLWDWDIDSGGERLDSPSDAWEELDPRELSEEEATDIHEGARGRRLAEWDECAPDVTQQVPREYPWKFSEGLPCYAPVREYQGRLQCPRGTQSNLGSKFPDHCLQKGEVIAIQNVYKCYPPRPCAHRRRYGLVNDAGDQIEPDCSQKELVLCNISEQLEEFKSDNTYKKSYIWNEKITPGIYNRVVTFFGFDPDIDLEIAKARPFHKIKMQALDIAILYFNFTGMVRGTRLNAGGEGHVDIHIHSSIVPQRKLKDGHSLPMFLQRKVNSEAYYEMEIKILALEEMEFSVQLDLRHGGHVESLFSLNECLDIKRWSPSYTQGGTRNVFAAVVSRELLLDGNYELPYNMPPEMASHPGEKGLVLDMASTSKRKNDPQTTVVDGVDGLLLRQSTGKAFWNAEGVDTVTMPWLPFFSNCDIFDSHIILWDLFEMPDGVRDGCERYEKDKVLIVPPLAMDFSTFQLRMTPEADNCEFYIECHFEESMVEADNTYGIWREIEEAEMTLFYLTRAPVPAEDIQAGDAVFSDLEGGDALIPVGYSAQSRTGRIPRRVVFSIAYYQQTVDQKFIIQAGMDLSMFDDNEEDDMYWLKVSFQAMRWEELMNAFELPIWVYTILYVVIGMGAVAFTFVAWVTIRLGIKKTSTMPFRLGECYDFMLNWPMQGVVIATIPIGVLCAVIKISFQPFADVTQSIPCTYEAFSIGQLDENEQKRCRNGRAGTCFCIGGMLMLISGAKLLVPCLREEEEQFLLGQPTTGLNREGISVAAEKRQLIREVPIRFKRGHLIFVSCMVIMPLMAFWEFTYSDFFGVNALYFIVGFSFAMNFIDGALSKAVREELLLVPVSGAVNVVLFIGTLGANDFTDFCEGFFIELLIGIFERLCLGGIITFVTDTISNAIHWMRTRSWFWNVAMLVGIKKSALLPAEPPEDEEEGEDVEDEEQEGTPMEEAMDEIIGCGTTCMSTIQAPFLIYVIMTFPKETQIPNNYGIKESDLLKYLLFGLVVAPFQVMMDILMNHAVEMKDGVKIYDYMLYARQRWHNRLYRWLFDDPSMDRSIAEPLQSVNHLAFSPQFYFIETYYSWGMLMVLVSVSILLRWQMNPFDDPAFGFFCVQQVICNLLLDKIISLVISQILWKPRENALYRAFSRSVEHSLKRKEYLETQDRFRRWFFQKHTAWTINRLNEVFTPRALDGYKMKLNQLYQQVLALQPTHSYRVPQDAFPKALAKDEIPPELRDELSGSDSSDSEERDAFMGDEDEMDSFAAIEDRNNSGNRRGALTRSSGAMVEAGLPGAIGDALPEQQKALPPGEEPSDWLKLLEFPDELPMSFANEGFGSLAGLVSRAWLAAARRRCLMHELAENWGFELDVQDVCQECNRQESEDVASGLHAPSLGLSVTVVSDVSALILEFETTYSIPEFPFQDDQWRAFLVRSDSWSTLCSRCRGALGKGKGGKMAKAASSKPPVPPPALSDSPGSEQDTPSESPEEIPVSDDEQEALEDAAEVPEDWHKVTVSTSTRLQILYWASCARKRVARRDEWQAHRLIEEEQGKEARSIAETARREALHAELGDYSDESLYEESESSGSMSESSESGSGSGSGSGSSETSPSSWDPNSRAGTKRSAGQSESRAGTKR